MSSNDRRWIEGISRVVSEPYSSIFIIGFIYVIYFIYVLSMWMIDREYPKIGFDLTFPSLVKILVMSILIPYLFIGASYFANSMKKAFLDVKSNKGSDALIDKLNVDIDRIFDHSPAHYALIAVLILSFIFTPPPDKSYLLFYSIGKGSWTALLDIINWSATVIILYLMAEVSWIIICTSWALNRLSHEPFRDAVKIDLYSSDNVGDLGPLRNLVLFLAIFQFGGISLAAANFSSSGDYGPALLFFIPLFLFSIYLFLSGWSVIDSLLEGKRAYEVDIINSIYGQKKRLILDAFTNEDIRLKVNTDELSKSLDILSSERERLMNASKTAYDYKAIFIFITSSLLPFIIQYIIPIPKS